MPKGLSVGFLVHSHPMSVMCGGTTRCIRYDFTAFLNHSSKVGLDFFGVFISESSRSGVGLSPMNRHRYTGFQFWLRITVLLWNGFGLAVIIDVARPIVIVAEHTHKTVPPELGDGWDTTKNNVVAKREHQPIRRLVFML